MHPNPDKWRESHARRSQAAPNILLLTPTFTMLGLLSCGLLLTALQPALGIHVYLNPPRLTASSALSPADASAVLSQHLGLESFEPFRDFSSGDYEPFVGQGAKNSLLLTVEEGDADGQCIVHDGNKRLLTLTISHLAEWSQTLLQIVLSAC